MVLRMVPTTPKRKMGTKFLKNRRVLSRYPGSIHYIPQHPLSARPVVHRSHTRIQDDWRKQIEEKDVLVEGTQQLVLSNPVFFSYHPQHQASCIHPTQMASATRLGCLGYGQGKVLRSLQPKPCTSLQADL
eukprot:scaffold1603_cov415-Prasinococcus_capsulatus_cf.AAC.22